MGNTIKKVFFDFLDKKMAQQGHVIAVRKWETSEIYEIQVHLPSLDMQKWVSVPRIKVKVAEYEYRDYSPACWNEKSRNCLLFIDARHNGVGSLWARKIKSGGDFLFAPASAASLPANKGAVLCLGDESAIGHFLALKQLLELKENEIFIQVSVEQNITIPVEMILSNKELHFIKRTQSDRLVSLHRALSDLDISSFSSIYIAGHTPMVQGMRKIIKKEIKTNARIFVNGFWS